MREKIFVSEETRFNIIQEYKSKIIPVEEMWVKHNISQRVFYRILREENIALNRSKRNYHKKPKHDLTGKKYYYLFVEKMEMTNKSKNTWRCICKCDCGRTADVNTNYLMRGLTKTCGNSECQYHRQDYSNSGKNNVKFTGYEEISGMIWAQYKQGAKSRNLEFNITIEYAWNLFLKQNRKCALSGKNIYFGKTNTKEKTASIDRIDSTKVYVEGNIQWVHKTINIMKFDLENELFIQMCIDVANNYNLK